MPELPDWERAHGAPLFDAVIRHRPEEFLVDEHLGFEPSGDGEHDLLRIKKTSANTAWVARQLAAFATIPVRDVGYCGLKDRHAITTQWFSVRRNGTYDWSDLDAPGVGVLEVTPHRKKLRRGAHRGNQFRIVLRVVDGVAQRPIIDERLDTIKRLGVPNYFGPQRFGRGGANLDLAERLFAGRRMKREQRGIAISAARSYLFNEILDRRLRDRSWDRVLPGERVNLDGTGSVFRAEDEVPASRLAALDVHPTASLWGRAAPLSTDDVARLEREVVAQTPTLAEGLERSDVDAAHRATRLRVQNLKWSVEETAVVLDFYLPRGAFATSVLRELASVENAQADSSRT